MDPLGGVRGVHAVEVKGAGFWDLGFGDTKMHVYDAIVGSMPLRAVLT